MEEQLSELTTYANALWVLVSAALVFFMHAGFALVESGFCRKKNAVMVLMSIELILNAVTLNLVAFALMNGAIDGQVFALFVIAIAAAEVGVGLAMRRGLPLARDAHDRGDAE